MVFARTHLEINARQGEAVEVQVTLTCAHLDQEIGRHLVVEANVPLVAGATTEADALTLPLLDAQLAIVTVNFVEHPGLPVGDVVGEVCLHKRVCAAAHAELAGSYHEVRTHGLRVFGLGRSGFVPHLADLLPLRSARSQKEYRSYQQYG